MKKEISPCQHIGLFVYDLEKMTDFYTKELGFVLERDYVAPIEMMQDIFEISSACRIRYLVLGGFGMELFFFQEKDLSGRNSLTSGYNHWTLLVENKTEFCGNLERKGFKVIKVVKPHGYTYFIKDPEGNLMEIKNFEL